MLCWLPGADPSTKAEGDALVRRVIALAAKHVAISQQQFVTIALCEIDGAEVAVVYHVDRKKADRIAGKLRKAGVAASSTSGDDHAEMVLHQREPKVKVIGISNSGGSCPACEKYFGNTPDGFANVYWDSTAWLSP